MAIASTHYELADCLLDQGADPNAAGQGWTPLHQIVYTRRPKTGFNNPGLVPRDTIDSLTLAQEASSRAARIRHARDEESRCHQRRAQRLTYVGATPFWVAAQTLDLPYMRLLANRRRPLLANSTGDTPLLAASGLGIEKPGESPGRQKKLRRRSSSVWSLAPMRRRSTRTAIPRFTEPPCGDRTARSTLLVAAGARLDVKNKKGQTPWRIAEGALFEDAVLAQPQTAALLRRLMEERGSESRIDTISGLRDEIMKLMEMKMKRVALFLVLGTIAGVAARTSAVIPEQVRIEMGLIAGTAGTGQGRAGVQGHSLAARLW